LVGIEAKLAEMSDYLLLLAMRFAPRFCSEGSLSLKKLLCDILSAAFECEWALARLKKCFYVLSREASSTLGELCWRFFSAESRQECRFLRRALRLARLFLSYINLSCSDCECSIVAVSACMTA